MATIYHTRNHLSEFQLGNHVPDPAGSVYARTHEEHVLPGKRVRRTASYSFELKHHADEYMPTCKPLGPHKPAATAHDDGFLSPSALRIPVKPILSPLAKTEKSALAPAPNMGGVDPATAAAVSASRPVAVTPEERTGAISWPQRVPITDAELQRIIAACPDTEGLHARAIHALAYLKPGEQLLNIFQGGSEAHVMLVYDPALKHVFVRKVEGGKAPRLKDEIDVRLLFARDPDPRMQRVSNAYPTIYASGRWERDTTASSTQPSDAIYMDMEFIPGQDLGDFVMSGAGTPAKLSEQLAPLLDILMRVDRSTMTVEESNAQLQTYLTRTQQRITDAARIARQQERDRPNPYTQAFLYWIEQPTVCINGKAYVNPLHLLAAITPGSAHWDVLRPRLQARLVGHGDWTLGNTMQPAPHVPDQRARLIDNRGLKDPTDLLFDLAKMKFSMQWFVPLCKGAFTLTTTETPPPGSRAGEAAGADSRAIPSPTPALHFALDDTHPGVQTLQTATHGYGAFLASQPCMKSILTEEPHWQKRIDLMAGAQPLADLPYRIVQNPKATLAGFCAGTLSLNAWWAGKKGRE